MTLSLLNIPNQDLPFVSGSKSYLLSLRMYGENVFATISVDDEYIVVSRRVVFENNLFCYNCLEKFHGSLVFHNRYGADICDYTAYNDAITLEFIPVDEE